MPPFSKPPKSKVNVGNFATPRLSFEVSNSFRSGKPGRVALLLKTEANPTMSAELINQTEAAELFGVTEPAFSAWWKNGDFPIKRFKKGRVVRYIREEVIALRDSLFEDPPVQKLQEG